MEWLKQLHHTTWCAAGETAILQPNDRHLNAWIKELYRFSMDKWSFFNPPNEIPSRCEIIKIMQCILNVINNNKHCIKKIKDDFENCGFTLPLDGRRG